MGLRRCCRLLDTHQFPPVWIDIPGDCLQRLCLIFNYCVDIFTPTLNRKGSGFGAGGTKRQFDTSKQRAKRACGFDPGSALCQAIYAERRF
jgi:hypothetical protein